MLIEGELHTERVYEELEMLHALNEPKSIPTLQQELDYSTAELQVMVKRLEEKGAVEGTETALSVFRRRPDGGDIGVFAVEPK